MLTVDCLLIHSLKTITGFIDRNQRQSVKGIHSNQIIIQLAKQQITSCLEYACNHKLKQKKYNANYGTYLSNVLVIDARS